MSHSRFAATRLTPGQAHEVWAHSDEASAFTRPDYLAQLVDEVEWWGAERSGEVVAAWPLVRAFVGAEIGPPPFCHYVGPMFAINVPDDKYSRYWSVYADAFSAMVQGLVSEHPRFRFSMPPGSTDIRALQWWNFDHPGQAGFALTPRYTARIDLSSLNDDSALLLSFASDRRRRVRRWMASPPVCIEDMTPDRVIELHDETLGRSMTSIGDGRHVALRRLVSLVQTGAGCMFGMAPQGTDRPEAAVVVLDGRNESNGVICVASSVWRDSGLIAWANWQSLVRARSLGKRWFDFNGANSPGRAADKHLYGARPEVYFNGSFGAET